MAVVVELDVFIHIREKSSDNCHQPDSTLA